MKMDVPDILIASWPVVLTSRNALAQESCLHGVRQATRGTKKVTAKAIREIKHVLIVSARHYQAVAFYSSVMVRRNQNEHVGIDQDNGCLWSRRWKCFGNAAERALVSGRSILHGLCNRSRADAQRGLGLPDL